MNSSNRILLVSDNPETSRYFTERLLFEADLGISVERSGLGALQLFKSVQFDLVIVEWRLPDIDCLQLVGEFRLLDPEIPVIVVLPDADTDPISRLQTINSCQYVTRPFNYVSVSFAIRKGLEVRQALKSARRLVVILKEQNTGLQKQNILLAKRVEESTKNLSRLYEDLRSTYLRTIRSLAQAIDARDHYTHSHSQNVGKYAEAMARQLGFTVREIESLKEASVLHDIGKIGISDMILLKPSGLSIVEWEAIRRHPQTGAQIIEPLTFLSDVIEQVRQHHEHFDGSGYPSGLKGEQIHKGARILHVADAYDAMVSARSYRRTPLTREQALAELVKNTKTQFDPEVVNAFLKVINEL